MSPLVRPASPRFIVERCCEDLTHETFYVRSQLHLIAVLPTKQGAEDLARVLEEGTAPPDLAVLVHG